MAAFRGEFSAACVAAGLARPMRAALVDDELAEAASYIREHAGDDDCDAFRAAVLDAYVRDDRIPNGRASSKNLLGQLQRLVQGVRGARARQRRLDAREAARAARSAANDRERSGREPHQLGAPVPPEAVAHAGALLEKLRRPKAASGSQGR